MKKVLLDTNAYTALLRGDEAVLDALGQADCVFMAAVVLGELFAGFRGGNRYAANKNLLERFLARPHVSVLDVTLDVADVFGVIKQGLKLQGTPIPINDVWIAATAVETGAVLLTYDQHFKQVAGLRLWDAL